MKKMVLPLALLLFLPEVHGQTCTVTITPPSFTLQTNHTQTFTANASNCSGGTISWSLACTPTGSCSTGKLSSKTTNPTTYTAPGTASGSASTPNVAQITAKYSVGGYSASANVTTTAVQVNSLLITSPPPTGSVAAWQTYVLGNSYPSTLIGGINPILDWATIDTNGGNLTTINTNLGTFDTTIAGYFSNSLPTKKINLIVQGVTGGAAIGGGAPNISTPSYVLTALGSQIYYDCGYGQHTSPPAPPGGFPAVWKQAYFQPYQAFIQAVLNHYSSSSNSILANYIGYIRFGLSAGGEVYPFCDPGEAADNDWLTYVSTIDGWLHGLGSPIQLMTSINQDDAESGFTLPNTEAGDAWTDSMGFGSQGLQQKDYESGSCTSNWCANFATYYNDPPSVPVELQTVLLSDPIPNDPIVKKTPSQTGSLSQLIPFAIANHAEIFEIYPFDLLYAFDSSYCTVSGSIQNFCTTQNYHGARSYPSCYQNVIENAGNGVTPNLQSDCVLGQ